MLGTCSWTLQPTRISITQVRFRKSVKKFPVINSMSKYDPKHIPEPLFDDMYKRPMEVDPLGSKHPGIWFKKEFHPIKEMNVELMVPDLTNFKLKPYVSYKAKEIRQEKLTAKDLFDNTYATELINKAINKEEDIDFVVTKEDILKAKLDALKPNCDLLVPTREELEEESID